MIERGKNENKQKKKERESVWVAELVVIFQQRIRFSCANQPLIELAVKSLRMFSGILVPV